MNGFKKAAWIWIDSQNEVDCYGEFYTSFYWNGNDTACRISCDGDYSLFINESYVASWQYSDYEHYKIYDTVDITPYLQKGTNHFAVLVWHYGKDSQRYINSLPGVIFEVSQDNKILVASGVGTICRKSRSFTSGLAKTVTSQMGFGFTFDASKVDGWKSGNMIGGHRAVLISKDCKMFPRPIDKHSLLSPLWGECVSRSERSCVFDLGAETVGNPILQFISNNSLTVTVQWGEDLLDGHIRSRIGERDFHFTFISTDGINDFTNYMFRIGCRYLEIQTEEPINSLVDLRVGVLPLVYPVEHSDTFPMDPLDKQIYNVCVRTLELCMMDHYADTPWREQCLYAFDARNQMLCGYYAFRNGNQDYARSNLRLIAEDKRKDGLLSITCPCGMDLTIPSFSLHYFTAVAEYVKHTGDLSLAREVYEKLQRVLGVFLRHRINGLILRFKGENHWNFYDWSPNLEGRIYDNDDPIPDLVLNCLFLLACQNYAYISESIGKRFDLSDIIEETKTAARQAFFRHDRGLFALTEKDDIFTSLGNALAILSSLTDKDEAYQICDAIGTDALSDCSLSMKTFLYDAMLQTDQTRYASRILNEIRSTYGAMLAAGATSVWETAEGSTAFDGAGSLCHGWSAVPVYYYNQLLKSDPKH